MSGRVKKLSDEDRVLWNLVARSAKPLKGKVGVQEPSPEPMTMEQAMAMDKPVAKPAAPTPAKPRQTVTHSFDAPTHDKIAKGRLPIEGRVDLHGLTQDQAYSLLLSFLTRAYAGGVRYVLVITGKGSSSGGEGVLRRAVPAWLMTPPFRMFVSSHDHAARNHGGSGALYIRLRRHAVPKS
ncbi:Smr/MutS family protein [Mesorhizobium sp. YR577]|uniref:Smr/MutS family protein n=1 Tax=Mesorhizobium sp. YR577 TaxID=1884373 RepID=UPI0008E1D180|nr:Smr/MutS family protein [Mesorhizobium sp. YR577]SFU08890.1 DNA-nicking endonuclease, Smr domain [Mesorhizobium sp. YR577]